MAKTNPGFSEEEKKAMKERAAELRASKKADASEKAMSAKIDELPEHDRAIALRLHELVKQVAPQLVGKTYYGMPAWANADGKNVIFLQPASKFDYRYSTVGFEEAARLDEGNMWPTHYALLELTETEEALIIERLRKATE